MLNRRQHRAVIQHIAPKMREIAGEIWRDFYPRIPVDTGELRNDAYVAFDPVTAEIEFGYDEKESTHPHGALVEDGTSEMPARPIIREVAYRRRRDR